MNRVRSLGTVLLGAMCVVGVGCSSTHVNRYASPGYNGKALTGKILGLPVGVSPGRLIVENRTRGEAAVDRVCMKNWGKRYVPIAVAREKLGPAVADLEAALGADYDPNLAIAGQRDQLRALAKVTGCRYGVSTKNVSHGAARRTQMLFGLVIPLGPVILFLNVPAQFRPEPYQCGATTLRLIDLETGKILADGVYAHHNAVEARLPTCPAALATDLKRIGGMLWL